MRGRYASVKGRTEEKTTTRESSVSPNAHPQATPRDPVRVALPTPHRGARMQPPGCASEATAAGLLTPTRVTRSRVAPPKGTPAGGETARSVPGSSYPGSKPSGRDCMQARFTRARNRSRVQAPLRNPHRTQPHPEGRRKTFAPDQIRANSAMDEARIVLDESLIRRQTMSRCK